MIEASVDKKTQSRQARVRSRACCWDRQSFREDRQGSRRSLVVGSGSQELEARSCFMSITRRVFLRNGALAVVGTAAVPVFSRARRYSARRTRQRQTSGWWSSSSAARPTD